MGRGCVTADGTPFEGKTSTHGQPLSKSGADYRATIANLGGNPDDPFVIFDDVKELYAERANALRAIVRERRAQREAWAAANPELDRELRDMLANKLPEIDYEAIPHKDNIPTRQASSDVLAELSAKVNNMIVASADLANSDKTDGFLKKTKAFTKGDFSGKFFQAGVSELTMACVANGMALHGGVIPVCGTFFVFSDYMKPAVRLAALMHLHVIYIWTHDSFRVGEDGPTHQPIEHLTGLRSMPDLDVYRPADARETAAAYISAVKGEYPTCIVCSRQDLPPLVGSGKDALKGGYVISDMQDYEAIILSAGSEVCVAIEAQTLLADKGVKTRVVSMPCFSAFERQSEEYKESVLPSSKKARVAVEAGSSMCWYKYASETVCIDKFGQSGPAKKLFEIYGITAANVADKVMSVLKK